MRGGGEVQPAAGGEIEAAGDRAGDHGRPGLAIAACPRSPTARPCRSGSRRGGAGRRRGRAGRGRGRRAPKSASARREATNTAGPGRAPAPPPSRRTGSRRPPAGRHGPRRPPRAGRRRQAPIRRIPRQVRVHVGHAEGQMLGLGSGRRGLELGQRLAQGGDTRISSLALGTPAPRLVGRGGLGRGGLPVTVRSPPTPNPSPQGGGETQRVAQQTCWRDRMCCRRTHEKSAAWLALLTGGEFCLYKNKIRTSQVAQNRTQPSLNRRPDPAACRAAATARAARPWTAAPPRRPRARGTSRAPPGTRLRRRLEEQRMAAPVARQHLAPDQPALLQPDDHRAHGRLVDAERGRQRHLRDAGIGADQGQHAERSRREVEIPERRLRTRRRSWPARGAPGSRRRSAARRNRSAAPPASPGILRFSARVRIFFMP